MTRWWWVRHGPTHQKAFTGWRDVPADLSDTARISRLRAILPAAGQLVSSDLSRAVETANSVQACHDRLPHEPDLREFNFGDWDGLHFSEVAARDPVLSRQYWEAPGDVAPPSGESWNVAARRVCKVVDRINAERSTDIIAVAHFGVILTQLQRAAGITATEVLAQEIAPLSVTRLDYSATGWQVVTINQIP